MTNAYLEGPSMDHGRSIKYYGLLALQNSFIDHWPGTGLKDNLLLIRSQQKAQPALVSDNTTDIL